MKDLLSNFPEINPNNYGDDEVNALNAWGIAAHTMLEQQAAEIERLNSRWSEWKDSLNSVMEQRNALQAKLSAMEAVEPVAWKCPDCGSGQKYDHRGCINRKNWNKTIRDSVDNLLKQAGFTEDSSARHQLAMMNFDEIKH